MRQVEVIPYDPSWPKMFSEYADKIKSVLGNNLLQIHHIGSTSVPGLDSKDKIDIIIIVKEPLAAIKHLENIGYEYGGDWNIPFKYGLRYRKERKLNLHMFDFDHPAITSNLLFRDYLRNNPQQKKEYAQLKYNILEDPSAHVKKHPLFYDYTLRKSAFIKKILQLTKFDKTYMHYCTDDQEWEAAKTLRLKYFFTPNNIDDPYVWTFNHDNHRHFVFYKGTDIIGYAHLQLWPGQDRTQDRAAIRILVIDEEYRGQGHGTEFMSLIEKWLKLNEISSLHAESRKDSLDFYKKLGFTEMAFDDPDDLENCSEDIAVGKSL